MILYEIRTARCYPGVRRSLNTGIRVMRLILICGPGDGVVRYKTSVGRSFAIGHSYARPWYRLMRIAVVDLRIFDVDRGIHTRPLRSFQRI